MQCAQHRHGFPANLTLLSLPPVRSPLFTEAIDPRLRGEGGGAAAYTAAATRVARKRTPGSAGFALVPSAVKRRSGGVFEEKTPAGERGNA